MVKQIGLGRGLDALLGSADAAQMEALRSLPVQALQPGKYQPRSRMDQESLTQLADSIRAQGIMQPILAREVADQRYEIIAGERRWRAAQLVGLEQVPVLVRVIPDEAALAMSLIENIQRENLNPLEEAAGIKRLADEFGMTHQQAAEAVGRSRAAVSNLLRLLSLTPAVQELLMEERIDMGHARALLALEGVAQISAAQRVAQTGLSVRETEALVKRLTKGKSSTSPTKVDADVVRLQTELSDLLGARVQIQAKSNGSGSLSVYYHHLDQLDDLIGLIRGKMTK